GGCLYCEHCSSVFTDCTFSGNSSVHLGGAIYCYDSGLSLTGCTFSDNSAPTGGGAMYSTDEPIPSPGRRAYSSGEVGRTYPDGGGLRGDRVAPAAVGCTFTGNSGRFGGCVWCCAGSSPTFTDCSFSGNSAFGFESGAGGVMYSEQSSPVFTDCVMSDNSSNSGGAVYNWEGSPAFMNCVFSGNSASDRSGDGGALYLDNTSPAITNCTFSGNWSDRWGGSVHCWQADPVLTNCIIAFGSAGTAVYCEDGSESPVLSCCNLFGNAGGDWVECIEDQSEISGNMSADPLFCDRPGGDFTIDAGSPCAAPNSGGCGLVGALDVGCDSPVEPTSWGGIKAMYR
ncbi:MAG TPA: right-handed parallel beta-helix repeat-containing protein, partial [bacterium]|nr:right-handed parallel beta-helix repeat-containing protein [bacterium]